MADVDIQSQHCLKIIECDKVQWQRIFLIFLSKEILLMMKIAWEIKYKNLEENYEKLLTLKEDWLEVQTKDENS